MHTGVKLIVGAVLVVVVPWILLGFLSMGPTGWLAIGTVVAVIGLAWAVAGSDEGASLDRVNCAECGAPNGTDATACAYCGEPISGST